MKRLEATDLNYFLLPSLSIPLVPLMRKGENVIAGQKGNNCKEGLIYKQNN